MIPPYFEMTTTNFDIINRALYSVGGDPISSYNDGTRESDVAGTVYGPIVRALLSTYPWNFATIETDLGLPLAAGPIDAIAWSRAYQLPLGAEWIKTVTLAGSPIDFARFKDKIYTRTGAADQPVLKATFDLDEDFWPSYFENTVVLALCENFGISIAEDPKMANDYGQKKGIAFSQARTADSHGKTTESITTSRFIIERR